MVADTYYREDADGSLHWYNPVDVDVELRTEGRAPDGGHKREGGM